LIAYFARRSAYMALILILSSIAIFYSLRFAPGDPTGTSLNPLTIASVRQHIRHELGLDRPVYRQYFDYVGNVFQGDLGHSLVTGASIGELLKTHGKNSLILGFTALALSYLIAVPLGVLAAVKRNSWLDQLSMGAPSWAWASPTSGWPSCSSGSSPFSWAGFRPPVAAR